VALRPEPFGAIAYVGERDDFFALDPAHAAVALLAATRGAVVSGPDVERAARLAALGVCATRPPTPQRPHLGRSLVADLGDLGGLGGLSGLPAPVLPLVVNCFSTAHCPLRCGYCHADDLMVPFRDGERRSGLAAVARTAALVPAMVGVVTGGDPIVRPGRAAALIGRLAGHKRVVLDTSGVGDIGPLLPVLARHRVHVRVSLDSADRAVNDRARPVSPAYLPRGASAFDAAHATLRRLRDAGVPCSVQTVVGSHNDRLDDLTRLRDHLLAIGVRHWVLHVAVPAGKAARHRGVLPGELVVDRLRDLVADCAAGWSAGGAPIDVRVTGTHRTPNAVLLVDPLGRLCVERPDGRGKQVIWRPEDGGGRRELMARYQRYVDLGGHASRYLNGTLEPSPQPVTVA
jgi:MoaA/NifB/PqqE/SkfB family radical SAM enzyme